MKRKPRTRNQETMTEAAFFGWLRSMLRRGYMRGWRPPNELLKERRRAATKGRIKWEHQCEECKEWYPRKEIEVDHIVPCGTLKTFNDLSAFCEKLFCEKDGLKILCKPCHKLKTYNQK